MGGAWVIHVTAAGLWLGCVLVEIVFERRLAALEQWSLLASLHDRVDRWIELPALAAVGLTGAWLLYPQLIRGSLSGWLWAKLVFAALAILANLYCAALVFRRWRLAESGDMPGLRRVDQLQHKVGALVLLGLLGALGCALAMAG
ncbi:putative membrane protein [Pseudomonas nitritireducens]|uniref:Putative membrane protein n=1 Tax=Pseudomonas nitroreducens TaxID=46680 RepID=A0A7W7KNV3_PSENT|nr:hypothetical protein [Pseudomonas nitritireducens]MBB4866252.1 putative membrane protein [Pseudomonas nitritireducens]